MNYGWLGNRTKGFMKINSKALMKTFCNLASFCLLIDPSGKYLVRKIYLQPTIFCVEVVGTNSQVPLGTRASNSSDIAWLHLRSFRAWDTNVGSGLSLVLCWVVRLRFWIGFMDVVFGPSDYDSG